MCNASLNWNGVGFTPTVLAQVSFGGALFVVYGYNTIDCPVVNVTGLEPGNVSFHFLIYPVPSDCPLFPTPTVLSPDQSVGATWTGGPTILLLVRVA
ncbi:MAG TPA: hypothetical protein VEH57_04250 [Thermoplasmata archaeon]|nr:hypothetical protein [Thermoplasmata archaeon]